MMAHLVLRTPSGEGSCSAARLKTSITQAVLFPDPIGPKMPRTKEDDERNFFSVSPSGAYVCSKSLPHLIIFCFCFLKLFFKLFNFVV